MPEAPPLIAVTPIVRFPPIAFFESQSTVVASEGVGELDVEDFNLSIDCAPADGTFFIYKTSAKAVRKVLRVFVYGEVVAIEDRLVERISGTCPAVVTIQRITLRRPPLSTEQASTIFRNDVVMLSNVVALEQSPNCFAVDNWVSIPDRAHPEQGRIFLECGPNTRITSGPLHIGAHALFDVTLHRVDSYPAGCSVVHKVYSLVAHTVELVQKSFLQQTGWIRPDVAAMPIDEAIALVQSEMGCIRV